jgi:hypothetical protein
MCDGRDKRGSTRNIRFASCVLLIAVNDAVLKMARSLFFQGPDYMRFAKRCSCNENDDRGNLQDEEQIFRQTGGRRI